MDQERWIKHYDEASAFMGEGDFSSAEASWRRAWSEVREISTSDPRYLMTLEYFADCLCINKKFVEAEPLLQTLLESKESLVGQKDIRVGATHNTLAGLYFTLKKFKKAEHHCKRALEIHEECLGVDHDDTISITQNLAMLYHAQYRYQEAEPLYEQALAASKSAYGDEDKRTVNVAEHYAGLLEAVGDDNARKVKKTLILPILDRLVQVVGGDDSDSAAELGEAKSAGMDSANAQRVDPSLKVSQTNRGFAGSTLTGMKRDPRKSNQCLYKIKPLPPPDELKDSLE